VSSLSRSFSPLVLPLQVFCTWSSRRDKRPPCSSLIVKLLFSLGSSRGLRIPSSPAGCRRPPIPPSRYARFPIAAVESSSCPRREETRRTLLPARPVKSRTPRHGAALLTAASPCNHSPDTWPWPSWTASFLAPWRRLIMAENTPLLRRNHLALPIST
jgi:hypothetical protein